MKEGPKCRGYVVSREYFLRSRIAAHIQPPSEPSRDVDQKKVEGNDRHYPFQCLVFQQGIRRFVEELFLLVKVIDSNYNRHHAQQN